MKKTKEKKPVSILASKYVVVNVPIRGVTPLIVHAVSAAALEKIRIKQVKEGTKVRGIRDFDAEYESCFHYVPGTKKYGFPGVGFKKGAVEVATFFPNITKKSVLSGMQVLNDMAELKYKEIIRRQDGVYLNGRGGRVLDIRVRPMFTEWSTTLIVKYDEAILSLEQIFKLIDKAGFAMGVGDWRPQKSGNFGMYEVVKK